MTKLLGIILFIVSILMGLLACNKTSNSESGTEIIEYTFDIEKGVNLSHWISQTRRKGLERDTFITEEDFAFIQSIGYDHLRLPVDEEHLWDEEGNRDEAGFTVLHNAIKWAAKHDLRIIVDLHIIRSHHFNHEERPLWTDKAEQEKFVHMWEKLSAELNHYPLDLVAYELMNEAVADDPEDWNRLIEKTMKTLRKLEPNRKVVIGSNMWQSVHTFDVLRIPENDPNIILSFHFYEPMPITHYQARWVWWLKDYSGSVSYPGIPVEDTSLFAGLDENVVSTIMGHNTYYDKAVIDSMVQLPLQYAKERNLPLYCGEWGCLPSVDRDTRLQWYRDVRSTFEKHEIAWANWDYKGGFGIVNRETGEPHQDLIDVLLNE